MRESEISGCRRGRPASLAGDGGTAHGHGACTLEAVEDGVAAGGEDDTVAGGAGVIPGI